MLKDNWRTLSRINRLGDNALIVVAFLLSFYYRDQFFKLGRFLQLQETQPLKSLGTIESYFVVLGFGLLLYNASLSILGAYRSMRIRTFAGVLKVCVSSSAVSFLALGALLYLLKIDLSRSFTALFCALSGVLLFAERIVVLAGLRFFRAQGKNFRNVLVVGLGRQGGELTSRLEHSPELGLRVAERMDYGDATFESSLKRLAIDEVLFTDVSEHFAEVELLAGIATDEGVGVTLALDLFGAEILRSDVASFGGTPLLHYERGPGDPVLLGLKRGIDIFLSVFLLVVLAPLMVVIAALIRFDSKGPVLFRQERVGLNGRIFKLLKFRSMVVDAEQRLADLKDQNEMSGPVFKMRDDPRVTPTGRFLRKWSLDELPQLWNVLRGEMSLVGPRPPIPAEVNRYERKQRRRLSMRPGITCTWQVSGRNDIPSFEEWARLDLEYIDNWSLRRDFALMLKTVPAVLLGRGAR